MTPFTISLCWRIRSGRGRFIYLDSMTASGWTVASRQTNPSGPTQFTNWCRQTTTNLFEMATALDRPINWSAIATNVPALPAFIYSDTNPPTGPQRFYRVRQE